MPTWLHPHPDGILLQVLVQPRASRTAVVGPQGDELKIALTSPPVEGAANQLCCEFIAKKLGVAKRAVILLSGNKSRHKRLLVSGITADEALSSLSGD